MEIYQWMIKCTRQTEWIEDKGILLWLAFYVGGMGGGLYLSALYFRSFWGIVAGWAIVAVLKGGLNFLHLGKPANFWRMMARPQSSWLARGFYFIILFSLLVPVQLFFSYFLPGSIEEIAFKIEGGLLAVAVMVYGGFVLNRVKGIPYWNSAWLPVVFLMGGITGGFGLMVAMSLRDGITNISLLDNLTRILLILNILLTGLYLWRAGGRGAAGRAAVFEQLQGRLAPIFWTGVVGSGMIAPILLTLASYLSGDQSPALLLAVVAGEALGGLAMQYCILKLGVYNPILPQKAGNSVGEFALKELES